MQGLRQIGRCTVSDHLDSDAHLSAEERQESFSDMVRIALRVVASRAD